MPGQISGEDTSPKSPTSAGRRTQWLPLLDPLSSLLWLQWMLWRTFSCYAKTRGTLFGVSCPVGSASPIPCPSRVGCGACMSLPWLSRTAAEPRAACLRLTHTRCQIRVQRFYISVYLCYSEMVPCHWDRKQLWTEISASDGNVSSVMFFHSFF